MAFGISLPGFSSTRTGAAEPSLPPVVMPSTVEFDPTDPKKQARTDYAAALLANLAYEKDGGKVRAALTQLGFEDIKLYGFDQKTDTQAFVARKGQFVVVSFRGTQERSDIVSDAKATNKEEDQKLTGSEVQDFKRFEGAEVHRGFRDGRDEIWDPDPHGRNGERLAKAGNPSLLSVLQNEAAKPGTKFVFTGHSLGAAETTLAAAATSVQNPANSSRTTMASQIAAVITFGSPKVGNDAFVKAYDRTLGAVTRAFQHHTDVVRSLPPTPDFEHVVADQTLLLDPADREHPPSGVDSHRMPHYVDRLKQKADAEEKANAPAATTSSARSWQPRG